MRVSFVDPRVGHRPASRDRPRALIALVIITMSCAGDGTRSADEPAGAPPAASKAVSAPQRLGVGRPATTAHIAALDIDVNPDGVGLPAGGGTYAQGATVFAAQCAICHGAKGEGVAAFPRLIGSPSDTAFDFGSDVKRVKTIGNYWPYATTLYDYVHRTMPFNAPGSLTPTQVYALVAFLLAENGAISRTVTMNARSLPSVRMRARSHFVKDDRAGSKTFR